MSYTAAENGFWFDEGKERDDAFRAEMQEKYAPRVPRVIIQQVSEELLKDVPGLEKKVPEPWEPDYSQIPF